MFRSCEWKYLDHDPKTDQYRWEITIMDDDFTEAGVAAVSMDAGAASDTAAIVLIGIYSRRNLNVAGNLILLMQYIENKWLSPDIKLQTELHLKYVPEYPKYHDQVMDYLVFI